MATKYPEAILLSSIKANSNVVQLILFLVKPGMYYPVRQGAKLYIKPLSAGYGEVQIAPKYPSPHQLQSQGTIERLHGTLKSTTETFVEVCPREWIEAVPFLFAI